MQHSSGPTLGHDLQVQEGFGAGLPLTPDHRTASIHHDQISRPHAAFVDAAGRHQQLQRISAHHAAEVAAGAIAPSPAVDLRHGQAEGLAQDLNAGFAAWTAVVERAWHGGFDGLVLARLGFRCLAHPHQHGGWGAFMIGSWRTSGCCVPLGDPVGSGIRIGGRVAPFFGTPRPRLRSCRWCRSGRGNR